MISFNPIGMLKTSAQYAYDLPHQPCESHGQRESVITLNEHENFEQALADLETFSHIWILFYFHKNSHFKTKVLPPRGHQKRGLFATRSPNRPNAIGLSVCHLLKIQGRRLFVAHCDILDGTPILDIKPYLPYVDAVPNASSGWLESLSPPFEVLFTLDFQTQLASLISLGGPENLILFLKEQLRYEPLRDTRKRVTVLENNCYMIAYRTWRIIFVCDLGKKCCTCLSLNSAYTKEELFLNTEDVYMDKALHRRFLTLKPIQ